MMNINNNWGWKCVLGTFQVEVDGIDYVVKIGLQDIFLGKTANPVYIRVWYSADSKFIVGANLTSFIDPSKEFGIVNERLTQMPPSLRSKCIELSERLEKLKAFV